MAYKITKYRGKHKIKDTKTGKTVDIDIEKYMNGGGKKKKTEDKKDLSGSQVQDIRDTTGVQFTDQGANALFETVDPVSAPVRPDFNLGRYKDVGYFNVGYNNNEFTVSPTKRNPGNASKYKEYLDYLQTRNPDVKINRRNGYVPVSQRFEYGGTLEDLIKYMTGGEKDKKKELSSNEVDEVREATGLEFSAEAANSLFETVDPATAPSVPDFNLGRYKDVGYFNVGFSNGEFNVSPTKRNPGNHSKYKEYLDYLQEQNPDVKINRRPNNDGYLPVNRRLEYGGKMITVPKYMLGAEFGECPPGDVECQEQKRLQSTTQVVPQEQLVQSRDQFLNQAQNQNAENYNVVSGLNLLHGNNPGVTTETVPQNQLVESRQNFINQQQGIAPSNGLVEEGAPASTGEETTGTEDTGSLFSPSNDISGDVAAGPSSSPEDKPDVNYNIANPYAGVDIPGAANYLGQSIKNKNTFGIVASGLKVAAGLGRNIVSGLGQANRYNQVMEDYYKDQKKSRNPVQYQANGGKLDTFAYGGKKDEELATGEYMHGIMNPDTEGYNAEIEKGEYFQSNEGDIAEVIGDKHSKGGEKIQMEAEDRVLSDKLKLGGKTAKMLSEKYGLKLKAKDTYSTVLDRFRTKSKLKKILDEEAEIMKKIGDQDKVTDSTTRDFNLQVLATKRQEIAERKHPIEEQRKVMFDELFNLQEDSKPESERTNDEFEDGGEKEGECPEGFKKNADDECEKLDKEEAEALDHVPEGQSVDQTTNLFGGVTPDSFQESKERNKWFFDQNPNFDVTDSNQVLDYQKQYNEIARRLGAPTVSEDGKWGEQTDSIDVRKFYKTAPVVPGEPAPPVITPSQGAVAGAYLFPDEQPLPPSALQGTIKPERRFDRVRPSEIEVEPYLQDIRDREAAQVQSLEGLSPNVRAAVLANVRANNQTQESNVRNQIDNQNLQSQERAIYTNAQIQAREENASEQDRLAYEQRQYRAQALTDNDLNNYYNQLQSINKQRFLDIHNLNLINATNEDVYFDGQNFQRKNTDREILSRINV